MDLIKNPNDLIKPVGAVATQAGIIKFKETSCKDEKSIKEAIEMIVNVANNPS